MDLRQIFLPEFDQEMATTRRVIARVPGDKGAWRPHPKSFPLGHLAQLCAWMPEWITRMINDPKLDLSNRPQYSFETTETLLAMFDRNVAGARQAIADTSDEIFGTMWSLTNGDAVLMSMPRGAVVRQTINHLIHHRGQLSVYLRLVDVPVPSIYGPTADEPWGTTG